MNINGASFILTEACNMRCSYCYENEDRHSHNNMSIEVAMSSVDFLINETKKGDDKYFRIIFFGGEPLLNLDVLIKTFDYALLKSKEEELEPQFMIATNATVYNDEYENFLKRYLSCGGKIQLSIDGNPRVQDKQRIYANGKGSSSDIESVVIKYQNLFKEIELPIKGNLTVHSVISPNSAKDFAESYFYIRNLGFDGVWTLALQTDVWTEEDLLNYKEQLSKVAEHIFLECVENQNLDAYIAQVSLSNVSNEHPYATCQVGKNFVGISTDGKIYPCHKFMFHDRSKYFGDIINGITNHEYREQFLNFTTKNICGDKMCSSCDNTSCYRCVAINQDVSGDMLIGAPSYCKISRIEDDIRKDLFNKLFNIGLIKGEITEGDRNMENNIDDKELINKLVRILSNLDNQLESIDKFSGENIKMLNTIDNKINGLFDIISELVVHVAILTKNFENMSDGGNKNA